MSYLWDHLSNRRTKVLMSCFEPNISEGLFRLRSTLVATKQRIFQGFVVVTLWQLSI